MSSAVTAVLSPLIDGADPVVLGRAGYSFSWRAGCPGGSVAGAPSSLPPSPAHC
ncbi:hypothetical protein [Amycolatopsis sp. NPDC021455]|uniref:hypothetical protein n=1 Tax=Amycolatopsis sp. NPDC021455 TaxID=3154901 RepID=UPI00340508A9